MDILNLYDKLKGSYKDYLESFVTIKDKRIEERAGRSGQRLAAVPRRASRDKRK